MDGTRREEMKLKAEQRMQEGGGSGKRKSIEERRDGGHKGDVEHSSSCVNHISLLLKVSIVV